MPCRQREKGGKPGPPADVFLKLTLVVMVSALVVSGSSSSTLQLRKAYTYRNKALSARSVTNVEAWLDPRGYYLYAADSEKGKVWIVDWHNDRVEKIVDLSNLPCEWYYPERDKDRKPIWGWQFIPKSNLLFLGHCATQLLLNRETFQLVRTLIDPLRERGSVLFSPSGDFAVVTRIEKATEERSVEVRSIQTWELVAKWPSDVAPDAFTPDGRFVIELVNGQDGIPDVPVQISGCAVTFYEVPSGQVAGRWNHNDESQQCPKEPWTLLTKGNPYTLVTRQFDSSSFDWAIYVWDAWTGKLLHTIRATPYSLHGWFSASPDGQYVTVGTWDDPQDNPFSRDFTIWNLATGDVVYQAPRYKSKWGPNKIGSEFYPSFAPDGNHLLAVTPQGIEIYEILALAE